MFSIGDKVVYPMHGAGTIEAIEEKEIMGQTEDYYIIKMPIDNVKVMVPTEKAKEVGVRNLSNEEETHKAIDILSVPMDDLSVDSNWNKRYACNIEKIKSGSLSEVTEVFKELSHRHLEKGLAMAEKKMLDTSKKIILSELVLTQNENINMLDNKLEDLVNKSYLEYKNNHEDEIEE